MHIDPVGCVLLVVALAVGCFVYKHTRQAPASKGDVVGAIVCATSVLTALVLILGRDHQQQETPAPAGGGAPPASSSQTPGP